MTPRRPLATLALLGLAVFLMAQQVDTGVLQPGSQGAKQQDVGKKTKTLKPGAVKPVPAPQEPSTQKTVPAPGHPSTLQRVPQGAPAEASKQMRLLPSRGSSFDDAKRAFAKQQRDALKQHNQQAQQEIADLRKLPGNGNGNGNGNAGNGELDALREEARGIRERLKTASPEQAVKERQRLEELYTEFQALGQ